VRGTGFWPTDLPDMRASSWDPEIILWAGPSVGFKMIYHLDFGWLLAHRFARYGGRSSGPGGHFPGWTRAPWAPFWAAEDRQKPADMAPRHHHGVCRFLPAPLGPSCGSFWASREPFWSSQAPSWAPESANRRVLFSGGTAGWSFLIFFWQVFVNSNAANECGKAGVNDMVRR